MMTAGRPPSSPTNLIKIQEFRFDRGDSTDKALVIYLRAAPKGEVRPRIKDLMKRGYLSYLDDAGKPRPAQDDGKVRTKRGKIGKFWFDRSDPVDRDLYEFLQRAKGNRQNVTGRMQEFIREGFIARNASTKSMQQTDEDSHD